MAVNEFLASYMECDKRIRSIKQSAAYGEMMFLAKNLGSYDVFTDMSHVDKTFITHAIYDLLRNENPDYVRKTFIADIIGEKASPECGGLILVYSTLLEDPGYSSLCFLDRHNYLFDVYNKLKQFREIKCIESNFRTKHTQVYYNMIPRYVMDFANYLKFHPGCFRDIFNNRLSIRETVETIKYIAVSEPVVEQVVIGKCDACGGDVKEWFDLRVCTSCDMTTL